MAVENTYPTTILCNEIRFISSPDRRLIVAEAELIVPDQGWEQATDLFGNTVWINWRDVSIARVIQLSWVDSQWVMSDDIPHPNDLSNSVLEVAKVLTTSPDVT